MLEHVRRRTLALVEPLSEKALNAVHDPLMSPIAWDLGHIASFEELWLVRHVGGRASLGEELGAVYDPFTAPRAERGELPFLRSDECLRYMNDVRERTLACLEDADLGEAGGPLLRGAFVYQLVACHEQQHSETILQTLQIMTAEPYEPPRAVELPVGGGGRGGMVLVPGGRFEMGANGSWFSYDNERPSHECRLDPFWIDRYPVTNEAMIAFVEDGGYERPELWSDAGWSWRERAEATLPGYWREEGGELLVRSFSETKPIALTEPVCHVSWYEADAYARWAGKRLPSEAEWERAASWDERALVKHRYGWGDQRPDGRRANLDQLAFATAEIGAFPEGSSPSGAEQMLGDVWEWTASTFERYEGFEAFPYSEYSEPFFDGRFKVLRGGAWATQPDAVSATFRNWDFPDRRQIFAGFRCARDAEPGDDPG
jgi:iron(II)-dependent oxidoreductase